MIAHAKVNTDTIDATVLAKLCASGFLPEAGYLTRRPWR